MDSTDVFACATVGVGGGVEIHGGSGMQQIMAEYTHSAAHVSPVVGYQFFLPMVIVVFSFH